MELLDKKQKDVLDPKGLTCVSNRYANYMAKVRQPSANPFAKFLDFQNALLWHKMWADWQHPAPSRASIVLILSNSVCARLQWYVIELENTLVGTITDVYLENTNRKPSIRVVLGTRAVSWGMS